MSKSKNFAFTMLIYRICANFSQNISCWHNDLAASALIILNVHTGCFSQADSCHYWLEAMQLLAFAFELLRSLTFECVAIGCINRFYPIHIRHICHDLFLFLFFFFEYENRIYFFYSFKQITTHTHTHTLNWFWLNLDEHPKCHTKC